MKRRKRPRKQPELRFFHSLAWSPTETGWVRREKNKMAKGEGLEIPKQQPKPIGRYFIFESLFFGIFLFWLLWWGISLFILMLATDLWRYLHLLMLLAAISSIFGERKAFSSNPQTGSQTFCKTRLNREKWSCKNGKIWQQVFLSRR